MSIFPASCCDPTLFGAGGVVIVPGGGGGGGGSALDWKASVRAATVVPGTLATDFEAGDTIDGVLLVAGNRILIKNQVTASENGIYDVQSSGAPVRSADANTDAEVTSGMATYVEEGTQGGTVWFLTTPDPITLGVTPLTFAQLLSLALCGSIPEALSAGSTGAAGTDVDAAHCDHEHPVPVATPVELDDTTNAPGSATTLVRSDHVHAHGNRGGGSLHDLVTNVSAGFMSSADKVKLNDLANGVAEFGAGILLGAGTTVRYLWPGNTAAPAPRIIQEGDIPRAGTLRNLFIRVGSPSTATVNTVTYEILVNGVASGVLVTIAGSVAAGSDTVNSIVVAQGDRISLRLTKSAALPSDVEGIVATYEVAA